MIILDIAYRIALASVGLASIAYSATQPDYEYMRMAQQSQSRLMMEHADTYQWQSEVLYAARVYAAKHPQCDSMQVCCYWKDAPCEVQCLDGVRVAHFNVEWKTFERAAVLH